MRADGLMLPIRPALVSPFPSDLEWIEALDALLVEPVHDPRDAVLDQIHIEVDQQAEA